MSYLYDDSLDYDDKLKFKIMRHEFKDITLVHYTDKPLEKVYSCDNSKKVITETMPGKPFGLWVSAEGYNITWKDWCENEGFVVREGAFNFAYEIRLSDKANILRLSTREDIDWFTEKYVTQPVFPGSNIMLFPDWVDLCSEYQALIVSPYIWSRRLAPHTHWYYGWDCSSGVIWDSNSVKEIIKLPRPEFKYNHEDFGSLRKPQTDIMWDETRHANLSNIKENSETVQKYINQLESFANKQEPAKEEWLEEIEKQEK
jgi:hypothetical protein